MIRRVRLLFLVPFLTLAMLLVALAGPLSAGALSPKAHLARTRQATPAIPLASNLRYNGGPVMGGTTNVFAIFWEPTGSTVSANYNSLILRYFGDVGGSSLYHNNTQYKDSGGNVPSNSHLAGSFVDTAKYPSGTLSDAQIQGEVSHAQSVNGWSSGIDNIFFVFTAKGENICLPGNQCSFSLFCAYHNTFGTNTIYGAMPYTGTDLAGCGVPSSPNNNIDADSTINVTSHEQMEAATDPLLNAWFDSSGNEIGDKCDFNFGPTNSQGGDVILNGHAYEVQKEWDNAKRGCVLTGP